MAKNKTSPQLRKLGRREHIDVALRGVEAVRAWRKEHPGQTLDLRGADLSGIKLRGVNFSGIRAGAATPDEHPLSLRSSVLRNANFSRAYLRLADMSDSDLRDADFRGSQLSLVDFSFADLRNAKLSDCIFIATDFHRAKLDGSDLTNSIVGDTRWTATNLSSVRGLSTLQHHYPSTLDVETLFASSKGLPQPFLQGCGVPDVLVTNLPALIGSMEPIQFNSCFISFSYSDRLFAEKLYSRLRDFGVRVWFAPEDMRGGRGIYDQVDQAIQAHDRLLLILSEQSINSNWVESEIKRAVAAEQTEKRRKLFPIRLCGMESLRKWTCFDADSGKDLAAQVREYFIPNFSTWRNHAAFEAAFKSLVRDLTE